MERRITVLPAARGAAYAPRPMAPLVPTSAPPVSVYCRSTPSADSPCFGSSGGGGVTGGCRLPGRRAGGVARAEPATGEIHRSPIGAQLGHVRRVGHDHADVSVRRRGGHALRDGQAGGNRASLGQKLWRIGRRVAVLWVCGMAAHGRLLYFSWQKMDVQVFSDTLQAIAIGYLVCSLALLFLSLRSQLILLVGLVVGYWALLTLVPFGGHPAGTLEKSANLARYVDEWVMGSHRRDHLFAWIVPSLGFTATVLLGTFAGRLLRGRLPPGRKIALMLAIGSCLVAAGWLWSYWLPLNRFLWTSSMIVWAGGWSFLALAIFYGVIDIGDFKRWEFPFVVIGANALFAYVIDMVYANTLSDAWLSNLTAQLGPPFGGLLQACGEVGLLWLILWYMYRHRTFLRA